MWEVCEGIHCANRPLWHQIYQLVSVTSPYMCTVMVCTLLTAMFAQECTGSQITGRQPTNWALILLASNIWCVGCEECHTLKANIGLCSHGDCHMTCYVMVWLLNSMNWWMWMQWDVTCLPSMTRAHAFLLLVCTRFYDSFLGLDKVTCLCDISR